MNWKSKFVLGCVVAGALAVSAPPAYSRGGGGHGGGGGHASGGGHAIGGRPGYSGARYGGARFAGQHQFGAQRAGGQRVYAGRSWNGHGNGHWNGNGHWAGNGNWNGHHHGDGHHHGHGHGFPVYVYSDFYPYWYYPWGYGWYGDPYYYGAGYYDDSYGYGYQNGNGGANVVAEVQQHLANDGYYNGPIDGVMGNGTRRALRSFERSNGLPVDGRLDRDVLSRMRVRA